jgi:hypothetical protein
LTCINSEGPANATLGVALQPKKEQTVLSVKLLGSAVIVMLAATLGGCATPSSSDPAERHQHMRDAKQGATMPYQVPSETPRKPLHDHREMK